MRKTIRLLSLAAGSLLMLSVSCEKVEEPPFDTESNFVNVSVIRNSCDFNMIYAILDSKKKYDPTKYFENPDKLPYHVIIKADDIQKPNLAYGKAKEFKIKFKFEEPQNFKLPQDPNFSCFGPLEKMSVISIIEIKEK
jgi:hypothetical protein